MAEPEKIVLMGLTLILAVLSIWMQFVFLEERQGTVVEENKHEPDYYIENFTSVGMDEQGQRRYVLEAERLAHYADDDTALLDNPHIIQYFEDSAPRHTYSNSAWVGPDGDEVLLTGNVRVIQSHKPGSENAGGIMTSEKMRIRLKDKVQLK